MKTSLIALGLSEYEASIYEVLLDLSPTGASDIAHVLHLSRSSVYTAIERLIAKGLVGVTYVNGVKKFSIEDASALDHVMEQEERALVKKQNALEKVKKHLAQRDAQTHDVPETMIYEGEAGIKKILWDMLRQAPEESEWYVIRSSFEKESDWLFFLSERWQRQRERKHIHSKVLLTSADEKHLYEGVAAMDIKVLPKSYQLQSFSLLMVGDIVGVLSLEEWELMGTRIKNAHVAKNMQVLFQALWKLGK